MSNFTDVSGPPRKKRRSKWDVPAPDALPSSSQTPPTSADPSGAAAAAAARLNAMLAAQGKLIRPVTPPQPPSVPISSNTLAAAHPSSGPAPLGDPGQPSAEVEINTIDVRGHLTKGSTLSEINRATGAFVSVRGRFLGLGERVRNSGERPLYLHVQASSQEKVNAAVRRINEMISGGHPRPPHMPIAPLFPSSGPLPGGLHYVQDKVFVGLDQAPEAFQLTEKLQGPGGTYLSHIATQTGAKVHLRGRGSGFIEPTSGKESFEALYIYISHSTPDGMRAARKLCENLIGTVRQEYEGWRRSQQPLGFSSAPGYGPPPPRHPGYPSPYLPHPPPYGPPPPGYQGQGPPPGPGAPPPSVPPYGYYDPQYPPHGGYYYYGGGYGGYGPPPPGYQQPPGPMPQLPPAPQGSYLPPPGPAYPPPPPHDGNFRSPPSSLPPPSDTPPRRKFMEQIELQQRIAEVDPYASFSNGGTLGSSEQGPPRPEPEDYDLNLKPARNFPAISQESPHEDLASNKDGDVEVTAELQRTPPAAVDSPLMPPPKKPPSMSKLDFHLMPPPSLPGSLANRGLSTSRAKPSAQDGASSAPSKPSAQDGASSAPSKPSAQDGASSAPSKPSAQDGASSAPSKPSAQDGASSTPSKPEMTQTVFSLVAYADDSDSDSEA